MNAMGYDVIARRAKEVFAEDLKKCQMSTSRLFGVLLVLQWLAAIVAAWSVSPYTWSGVTKSLHIHLYAAFFLGAVLCLYPLMLAIRSPEKKQTHYALVISQVMFSSLLIHLTGGRIETHFHVFGSLAFVAFFRDWRLLGVATLIVAVDHFARGIWWPQSVYGVLAAAPWRTLEHAAWVLFEDIFLLYSIRQQRSEMKASAERRAKLESTNEIIEAKVEDRTRQLKELTKDLRQARDEALSSANAKSDFLANMSHEIRTPMNAIIGFSDLILSSEKLEGETREAMNCIHSSAHHLLGIVNDILDFSKLDKGKLLFDSVDVEFRSFMEETMSLFEGKMKEKNITEHIDISSRIPQWIRFDPLRLRQIITNLVGNAMKFTELNGAIVLRFDMQKATEDGYLIEGSVADSGIGMSEVSQLKIFEAFEQADGSHTRQYGGSGLGLAITTQLLSLMQGGITVSSKEGVGTCFRFTFHVEESRQALMNKHYLTKDTLAKQGKKQSASSDDDYSYKILVAEDNLINQKLISKILAKLGCCSTIVSDGQQAVESFIGGDFDLILMDIQMPVLNGIAAMKKIRKWQQAHKQEAYVPIVALTAHAMAGDREKYIEEGMDEYLSKPIDRNALSSLLAELLDKE